jgi:hypothetical protein
MQNKHLYNENENDADQCIVPVGGGYRAAEQHAPSGSPLPLSNAFGYNGIHGGPSKRRATLRSGGWGEETKEQNMLGSGVGSKATLKTQRP